MLSSDRQIINSDCIVIGGDITALIISNILQRKGIKVTVLDKNQKIGGRLSTRRLSEGDSQIGVFDDGIQYFSVEDSQFQVWVDDWLEYNVIKKWSLGFDRAEVKPYYCGVSGNYGIAKYLAKNLDVYTNTEVIKINYEKKWSVETQSDRQYQGHMLVMTSPVPESLSLLNTSLMPLPLEIRFSLEQIEYDSCITVLALLEKQSKIIAPGGMKLQGNSLAWLADNYQKGISPNGYGVTLQATPKFSREYWRSDDAEIAYKLLTTAADYLDSPVIKYQVHRWGYNLPQTFYSEPCLGLLELPLIMAGDAFVAPTVEGAVMSGIAAAELICQRFRV